MPTPIFSTYKWMDKHVSVSLIPDGTGLYGNAPGATRSNLFSLYNAYYPPDMWMNEIKKALAVFQNNCGIVFNLVNEQLDPNTGYGYPVNTNGLPQGDPRFGDIRIGADPALSSLDLTYYPQDPDGDDTLGGSLMLTGKGVCTIGTNVDLQSLMIHSLGIALGMLEGQPCGPSGEVGYCSVLNGVADKYTGPYRNLYPWDAQGFQSLYGPPPATAFVPPAKAPQFTNAVFLDPNGEYMKGARIQDAYMKMLMRMPAGSEIGGWANTPTEYIMNAFALSPEFYSSCANLDAWIIKTYQHGLNRTPGQSEIDMWHNVLTS